MQKSESIGELAKALSRAQAAVQPALKTSENPHLGSRYADLASVWAACRHALSSNGLSIVQLPVSDGPGYVALETIILHESGEYIANTARTPAKDPKGQETAQSVGSAITYLRRYALSAALGIVADTDDDGHTASHGPPSPVLRDKQEARQIAPRPDALLLSAQSRVTLSKEKASDLLASLQTILKDTAERDTEYNAYAAKVIGREVGNLTELTPAEARQVYHAARALPKAS
ncbi:ERF family protein [Deinococcus humi]|uniref:Uncharacterized protein n=1 Tax=Deinococcus humi TaxID=662880 RepID=A0A7W8NF71_9DEIO|nr:hypothetical protein [Deinococcus humi]GGO28552.1 hypothetical protein GCM10008949_21290 [Deinococcus humi]